MTEAEEIARQLATATDRQPRRQMIRRWLASQDRVHLPAVYQHLLNTGQLKLLVDIATHPRATLPTELISKLVPLVADAEYKRALRIRLAAKLIEAGPAWKTGVKIIAAGLTKGLGKRRTFEVLVRVQHRVKASAVLDRLVAAAERRVVLECPKCKSRLPRKKFIKHLWHKHRLIYRRGKACDPGPEVEVAIRRAASDKSPKALDRVYALALQSFKRVEPVQLHQAILARTGADSEDLDSLKAAAIERSAGLCPTCYAFVPNPVPVLPPLLNVTAERLSGDGFEQSSTSLNDARTRGVLWGLPAAIATVLAVPFAPPMVTLAAGTAVTAGLYEYARRKRSQAGDAASQLVDAAWRELVPRVGRTPGAIQFLTRLCRTSLDHGRAESRAQAVWSQVEQAAVLSGKSTANLQWFAAVRVLQASDAGHIGKDWIPALVGLFAPLFRAEASPLYTEAAAEALLHAESFEDRDAARLRIALAREAINARFSTADFNALTVHCPQLARLFAGNDAWYDALRAVAHDRRPWKNFARAQTVFEYAKSPATGKMLAAHPDTLLVDDSEAALGLLLIGQRGITVDGITIADEAQLTQWAPKRNWRDREVQYLRRWLRLREELLTVAVELRITPRLTSALAPLATDCPLCRHACLVTTGEVGTHWPLS